MEGPHGNHFFVVDCPGMSQPGVWRIDARISRVAGFDVLATINIALQGG